MLSCVAQNIFAVFVRRDLVIPQAFDKKWFFQDVLVIGCQVCVFGLIKLMTVMMQLRMGLGTSQL